MTQIETAKEVRRIMSECTEKMIELLEPYANKEFSVAYVADEEITALYKVDGKFYIKHRNRYDNETFVDGIEMFDPRQIGALATNLAGRMYPLKDADYEG